MDGARYFRSRRLLGTIFCCAFDMLMYSLTLCKASQKGHYRRLQVYSVICLFAKDK